MKRFWQWYERNYTLNLGIAAGLFLLQIFHLIWLFAEVIWQKIFGFSLFTLSGVSEFITILVDYTEIPALITTSFVYINELRERFSIKSLLYLFFLNSQWIHLFWITDEFVVETFLHSPLANMAWLAWVAILIDYLEVPVILDTIKKFFFSLRERGFETARQEIERRN